MTRSDSLSRSVETRTIARLAAFPSTARLRTIGSADNANPAGARSLGAKRAGGTDGGAHGGRAGTDDGMPTLRHDALCENDALSRASRTVGKSVVATLALPTGCDARARCAP